MLVLLALITSVIAGTWLEAVLKRGRDLLDDGPGAASPEDPSRRSAGIVGQRAHAAYDDCQ
jgi:hypothetical protein